MQRVSTDMMNNDLQFWLRRTESSLSDTETQIGRQKRINNLRDDPEAAGHAVRYASYAFRLDRFEKNGERLNDSLKVTEDYAQHAVDIMQKVRELAVRGANGSFDKDQMGIMASEIDEYLNELVATGNAKSSDGTTLFSGDKTGTEPFLVTKGNAPGSAGETITSVDYIGSDYGRQVEIGENNHIESTIPGNKLFWADKQLVISSRDARGFRLDADASIRIDGKDISLKTGDNAFTIAAKINDSGVAAKASLDPESGGFTLQTTDAHQLMLEDGPDAKVFAALGLLKDDNSQPPRNYAGTARVAGGSLFDSVIRLRDSLRQGDVIETGGAALRGIDSALSSLERRVSEIGSRTERVDATLARLSKEIPDVTGQQSREEDLDFTQAAITLNKLERTHQASLQTAGQLLPKTLLDYLR
jgi:flagellar hook-associated protein 3 FlgL